MKLKLQYKDKNNPIILGKFTKEEKEIISFLFERNEAHAFSINNREDFFEDKHFILNISNFKEFIFSEESIIFPNIYKIFPTKYLELTYPETFGKYGENIALYKDNKIKDISKVYYPNIEYVREYKENYLKNLFVVKIKNNKIIYSENISKKYFKYIKAMLKTEELKYRVSGVFIDKDIYTYYNFNINKLLLDIAATLDKKHSYYRKSPWSIEQNLGDDIKFFPEIKKRHDELNKIRKEKRIPKYINNYQEYFNKDIDSEEHIPVVVFVINAIRKKQFNSKIFKKYKKKENLGMAQHMREIILDNSAVNGFIYIDGKGD